MQITAENFYDLSESPLKVRKIAVYRFLISFLVPKFKEVWGLKIWKSTEKNGTKNERSWIKSIKIDKICDVIYWTSDCKQSLNILCLRKCLSKLKGNYKTLCKRLVVIAMMSVPGSFNGNHEMKHNSAITRQNQLEFRNQKTKQGFS